MGVRGDGQKGKRELWLSGVMLLGELNQIHYLHMLLALLQYLGVSSSDVVRSPVYSVLLLLFVPPLCRYSLYG